MASWQMTGAALQWPHLASTAGPIYNVPGARNMPSEPFSDFKKRWSTPFSLTHQNAILAMSRGDCIRKIGSDPLDPKSSQAL